MATRRPLTPDSVEEMKDQEGFDERLAGALIPSGHPQRNLLKHPILRDMILRNIRENIDPILRRFIASGAAKIPRSIYSRAHVRTNVKYGPGPSLEKLVREFLQKCYAEHDVVATRAEVRSRSRRIVELLVEVVRRNERLAKAFMR